MVAFGASSRYLHTLWSSHAFATLRLFGFLAAEVSEPETFSHRVHVAKLLA